VGKKTGKNPTDRGKLGVKRSVITDSRGVPLGIALAGANVHDAKLLRATLQSIPVPRPKSAGRSKQHLCLDKGYCGKPTVSTARSFRYIPHIPRKGEVQVKRRAGQRARRWVVEGSHSWTNRARRLLIRWEKKVSNYLAFVHLQFAYIALKQARVWG
jgi:putative transposase